MYIALCELYTILCTAVDNGLFITELILGRQGVFGPQMAICVYWYQGAMTPCCCKLNIGKYLVVVYFLGEQLPNENIFYDAPTNNM